MKRNIAGPRIRAARALHNPKLTQDELVAFSRVLRVSTAWLLGETSDPTEGAAYSRAAGAETGKIPLFYRTGRKSRRLSRRCHESSDIFSPQQQNRTAVMAARFYALFAGDTARFDTLHELLLQEHIDHKDRKHRQCNGGHHGRIGIQVLQPRSRRGKIPRAAVGDQVAECGQNQRKVILRLLLR